MKKIIISIITAFTLLTINPVLGYYTEGYLNYEVKNGSITIIGSFGKNTTLTVPSSIAGYPVNTIATGAFTSNKYVKTVNLPDTITTVQKGAFPEGVTVNFNSNVKPNPGTKPTVVYKASSFKLSTTTYTYNGSVKKPSVTVKNSYGNTMKNGTDYTVTYASGRKNVGKYKVTIKGKGKYSFTKTLYFTIKPVKTTISKLTKYKKAFTVKITKKSTQVTGYQIQYSTSSKFASGNKTSTITSYKTVSKKITGLKAKKKYYVRVRTYKTVSGTKYYSSWSSAKSVTTK